MDNTLVDNNTILQTIAGSRSYGTNTETSDLDVRGICLIPDKSLYFGMQKFEQKDDGWDPDKVVYQLPFYCKLASECNPNTLELLWTDDSDILKITPLGQRLRENRHLFLSRRARWKYTGYSFGQLKSLQAKKRWTQSVMEKPTREDFVKRYNIIVGPMGHSFGEGSKLIRVVKSWEESGQMWHEMEIETFDKGGYEVKKRDHENFSTWKKNRNKARAELEEKAGYDSKYALHLVRLMRQGYELLTEGVLKVRRPDAEELKSIRAGAWTFDQLVNYAKEMEEKIGEAEANSPLPHSPDMKKIEQLQIELIERALRGEK